MEKLKNMPIARLDKYEHSLAMLVRFNLTATSRASAAKQTRRAPAGRKTTDALGVVAGARKTTAKNAARESTTKTAVKKAAKCASRRKPRP